MTKDLEQHWNEYMRTKSTRVRELLIKQYQPLVEYVANGFKYSGSSVLEHQDLISAGLIGLLEAIERYDFSKKVQFCKKYLVKKYNFTKMVNQVTSNYSVWNTPRSGGKARKLFTQLFDYISFQYRRNSRNLRHLQSFVRPNCHKGCVCLHIAKDL